MFEFSNGHPLESDRKVCGAKHQAFREVLFKLARQALQGKLTDGEEDTLLCMRASLNDGHFVYDEVESGIVWRHGNWQNHHQGSHKQRDGGDGDGD